MSAVKFFILTSAQYAAIDPTDDGTLYFVSDQNRIYKGTVPYSHPIELVDEFPATGLVGTLYVNTSTKEGKAWNGSAWVTVQLAVSTTLDDSDEAIPTSKAVKEYVDGAVENIVAGGGAVTDVTYADKTITVKKGTNSTTPLQLTGLVDGAEYDGASGKLTFTTNGGTPIEITLPVEQFLAAAAYDAETHILSLTMTDNTKFDVDLGDLIDVYEAGETESISVSVSGGAITASLKVSAEAENQLQIRSDGAYVPPLSWQTMSRTGRKNFRLASTRRMGKLAWRPRVSSIFSTGGVSVKGAGLASTSQTASASSPTMVCGGGEEACPPRLSASRDRRSCPFSAVPTRAQGCFTPGNAPVTTAPPSSSTSAGRTPRSASAVTMSPAEGPAGSSSPEKAR